jgi:hypothetical protein
MAVYILKMRSIFMAMSTRKGLHDATEAGQVEVLVPGKYIGNVVTHKEKKSKNGFDQIETKLSVLSGPPQGEKGTEPRGRTFTDTITWTENEQNIQISNSKLKSLLTAVGVKVNAQDQYDLNKVVAKNVGFVLAAGKKGKDWKEGDTIWPELKSFFDPTAVTAAPSGGKKGSKKAAAGWEDDE